MARITESDFILSSFGNPIDIGPIRLPNLPSDPATKEYVDAHPSGVPNVDYPLAYDIPSNTISIKTAGIGESGIVTAGAQTLSGQKTFADQVTVPYPTGASSASNKEYVDFKFASVSGVPPISVSSGEISIPPASGTLSGYITSAGSQTIGGDKNFTGNITTVTPGPLAPGTQVATKEYVNDRIVSGISGTAPISVSSGVVSIAPRQRGLRGIHNRIGIPNDRRGQDFYRINRGTHPNSSDASGQQDVRRFPIHRGRACANVRRKSDQRERSFRVRRRIRNHRIADDRGG